ncbi:MAG: DUF1350 family protein [Phormidesmis sp. CAN_BIN44]|nr:DUF1350 family protein [Phormidesmis sp. CAN_BIN44]
MDWQEISGNWVLVPDRPIAIVHFLGGAFVATAPQLTYRRLLEYLASQGYAIVATPFVNTFDHIEIAKSVLQSFDRALEILQTRILKKRYIPVYGMGHSMGCKLHLLIGSLFAVERAGNILISFNNFSARDAVPLVEQFSPVFSMEFAPSPLETNKMIGDRYQIRRNLLVKFDNDSIDQTYTLSEMLKKRFPDMVTFQTLKGSHTTPIGQDIKWQTGSSYSPFDAIGQWMRQEIYRELEGLEKAIVRWLNPMGTR